MEPQFNKTIFAGRDAKKNVLADDNVNINSKVLNEAKKTAQKAAIITSLIVGIISSIIATLLLRLFGI